MASSTRNYTYTQAAANEIPADAQITIDDGALTYIEVTLGAQIGAGATSAIFKKNRTIKKIVSWQLIRATGAYVPQPAGDDHTLLITANNPYSLTLGAVGNAIPQNTIVRILVILGN